MAGIRNQKFTFLSITILVLVLIFLVNLPVSAGSFDTWNSLSSGVTEDLYGLWGTNAADVFAVGESGTILHYDGSTWSSMSSGAVGDLYSVWGTDSSHVWAAGASGTILEYDGSIWSPLTSNTTNNLFGIWGVDNNDIFAVGSAGTILHYDGSIWNVLNSGITVDLLGIWGSDDTDVFTVGKAGTILYYDGSSWSSLSSGITGDLNCIWGSGSDNVFTTGGSGALLYYDGSAWNALNSDLTGDLYGVWGSSAADVFVVGTSGAIAHYDGTGFSSMNRTTSNQLRTIWGFSSSDIFAAGFSGTILRYAPPVISSISPGQGNQGETLNITINGTNLSGITEVRLGSGVAVNSYTVVNSTQVTANITVVSGAALGTRDVSVTAPGGNFTLPDCFTVKQSLPAITSLSPGNGVQGATFVVTLTGVNLAGTTEVQFGADIAVNSFTALSSNQITANITIAADAETGTRDVSITTSGGSFILPDSFIVKPALPIISSISPGQGNREATFNLTINGTNFTGASEIQLGAGVTVNKFTVISSNQISANLTIASGAEIGFRNVSITTPGGSFTLPNSFTIKPALPVLTSVSPATGSQGATLNVILNGTDLSGATEVRLGSGIAVNSFTVPNSTQIIANVTIVASAEIGVRDVWVTTAGGSCSLTGTFTVKQGLPVVTSVNPVEGSQGDTLTIVISGSNLNGATAVSFGSGAAVQSFNNLSPTQLSVNVILDEKAVTGMRDVSVTTPGGSSTLGHSFNVKEKSTTTLFIALLWIIIAIVIGLFIFILNLLRKKRALKI